VSGFYYPVGGAVCRILSRDADKVGPRCLVEPTSGNAANVSQLRKGDVDLAVMQSRAVAQARSGEGPFADQGAFPALRAVAALHSEPVLVLVAKSAKIRSLADLKGKKVNLGRPQSFQRMMAEATLAAAGLAVSDLGTALEIDFDQQPVGLCDGRLEAAFFTGIHPMTTAEQALEECGVEALNLKGPMLQEAVNRNPYLATSVIAAETYPGIETDTTTIAMKAVLVTTSSLPESSAAQVAKGLADNFRAFVDQSPALRGSTRDGLARDGIAIPLHPGAEKAYREAGVLK
jgi:TRAP transporter TAXI family solute receptor